MVRLTTPTHADIADLKEALGWMPGSWGPVDVSGRYTPSIDERQLWLMMRIEGSRLRAIVTAMGFDILESNWVATCSRDDLVLNVRAYKVTAGLLRRSWFGNILVVSEGMESFLGAIGGISQLEMWESFRNILELKELPYETTDAAIEMSR